MGEINQDIIARVNGTAIPRKKLEDLAGVLAFKQYKTVLSNLMLEKVKAIQLIAMDDVIANELFRQEGKRIGITVSEEELEAELSEAKKDFPFPELYKDFLRSEGISEEEFKATLIEELLIKKTREKFFSDYSVSEDELKTYYEGHKEALFIPERLKACHILIKTGSNSPEDKKNARMEIEKLKEKIDGGEDFGKIAREYSQCPSSYDDGDLGYLGRGQTVEEFDNALFSLKEGEVSGVVETEFGFHLIYLKERLNKESLSFEDLKEEMEEKIKEDRKETIIMDVVERLKKNANIEILNGTGTA